MSPRSPRWLHAAGTTGRPSCRARPGAWAYRHPVPGLLGSPVLDTAVPERLAQGLELAVGAMLVLLGADLLRRLLQKRVHFHTHHHGDGTVHFHAHSHAADSRPHTLQHTHEHHLSFPARALYVGLVHGLAGSAALILLALGTVGSPVTGLLYVGLFGLGSIGGMALLSLAISVPLHGARNIAWLDDVVLQATVGLSTIVIGTMTLHRTCR